VSIHITKRKENFFLQFFFQILCLEYKKYILKELIMGNVNKKHIDDENLHIKKCVQESIKLQESTRLFKILILGTGETGKSIFIA